MQVGAHSGHHRRRRLSCKTSAARPPLDRAAHAPHRMRGRRPAMSVAEPLTPHAQPLAIKRGVHSRGDGGCRLRGSRTGATHAPPASSLTSSAARWAAGLERLGRAGWSPAGSVPDERIPCQEGWPPSPRRPPQEKRPPYGSRWWWGESMAAAVLALLSCAARRAWPAAPARCVLPQCRVAWDRKKSMAAPQLAGARGHARQWQRGPSRARSLLTPWTRPGCPTPSAAARGARGRRRGRAHRARGRRPWWRGW